MIESEVYDCIPEGWKVLEGTTAPRGCKWISNNKSLFSKERRVALCRISQEKKEPSLTRQQESE